MISDFKESIAQVQGQLSCDLTLVLHCLCRAESPYGASSIKHIRQCAPKVSWLVKPVEF